MLLKRWFLRKEVVTDISHFEVQGVYLPKELAGGGGGGGGGKKKKKNAHQRGGGGGGGGGGG